MRKICFVLGLCVALMGSGCIRGALLRPNTLYETKTGMVVVKGLGAKKSRHVTCFLTPGARGSVSDKLSKIKVPVKGSDPIDLSHKSYERTLQLYEQTEKLAALELALGQLCLAYGNGAFGPVDKFKTGDRYFEKVNKLIEDFGTSILRPTPEMSRSDKTDETQETGSGGSPGTETPDANNPTSDLTNTAEGSSTET